MTLSSPSLQEDPLPYLMNLKYIISIKSYFIKSVYYKKINIPILFAVFCFIVENIPLI